MGCKGIPRYELSSAFSEGPSTSASGSSTSFRYPAAAASSDVIALVVPEIVANFDLDNCEVQDVNDYIETQENKENKTDLSDNDINQYMQMFEKSISEGRMFQGCTVNINNPVLNITIQKQILLFTFS